MHNIKLSIIIPVYNVEKYISECLDSILSQIVSNVEIICIEDGSTDNSIKILNEYKDRYPSIHIVKHESNRGLSAARNTGLQYAKGEYVWFVDSDDYIKSDAIKNVLSCLEEKYDLIKFNAEVVYENDIACNKTDYFIPKADYSSIINGNKLFIEMMRNDDFCVPVWLMILNRQWLLDNHIDFREDIMHEDNLYTMQCLLKTDKIKYLTDKLYFYRVRKQSLTTRQVDCYELYSIVVIFSEIIKILDYNKDEEIREQLIHYANDISSLSRRLNRQILIEEKINFVPKDAYIDMQFRAMGLGAYETDDFDEELYIKGFETKINECDGIVLYGAGNFGKNMFQYLSLKGVRDKISCFAVTHNESDKNKVYEVPIYEIGRITELYENRNVLVILSVGRKLQQDLWNNCSQNNIKNVIKLDAVLEKHIREVITSNGLIWQ